MSAGRLDAFRMFVLSSVAYASCMNAGTAPDEARDSRNHGEAGCSQTQWTSFRKSLEEGITNGFLTSMGEVQDGPHLATQVSEYLEARIQKDVARVLSFLVDLDSEDLEAERTFYERELPGETLLRYTVRAAKSLDSSSTDFQVFAIVVVTVNGKCYEDVLTTRWRRTPDGWKLLPSGGVESVS